MLFSCLAFAPLTSQAMKEDAGGRLEEPVTITTSASAISQYTFRGRRLGGSALETSIEVEKESYLFGIWGNFPAQDKALFTSETEVDLYGTYIFNIGKEFKPSAGFTLYAHPRPEPKSGRYRLTFEPNLGCEYEFHGFTFSSKLYYDLVELGPTAELSASCAVPLKTLGTGIELNGSLGAYYLASAVAPRASRISSHGEYLYFSAAIPFQLTLKTKISLAFSYTRGWGANHQIGVETKSPGSPETSRGVVTIDYTRAF